MAARQADRPAGLIALALYAVSPEAWHPEIATATALVLFVFLATAVGVGHALQGPARKWPPRLALLVLCTAAAVLLQPLLCFAAIFLAASALWYLAERKRVWVAATVACLAAEAALVSGLRPDVMTSMPAFFAAQPAAADLFRWGGILLALAAGLGLWAVSRRSRFFGHTGPLIAAALFAWLSIFLGDVAWWCALPPALLFVAGVFADGFDSERRRWWQVTAWAACLVQMVTLILLTS